MNILFYNYKKLSKQQKRLLLWIAEQEGRFEPRYFLPPQTVLPDVIRDGRFLPEQPPEIRRDRRRQGIRWRAADFLGHPPTSSESSALNRSLASLEKRKLIKRTQSRGKRQRTTHVKMTLDGVGALQILIYENDKTVAK